MAAADPDESALRSRIEAARQAEAQAETKQTASLWERISSVEAADEREAALATARDAELPIVCLDAMLPGQRLELTTEDPTFCELLREIGLGGLFCMRVRLLHGEDDVLPSASTLGSGVSALAEAADAVLTALAEWEALARADSTYDNVDVVAGGRAQRGAPGLRLDPARLLDAVQEELGPRPEKPTALALWVAALINPLPSLGIAPEIRAAVLQAPGAEQRLRIVERGVRRSIANLSGKRPL